MIFVHNDDAESLDAVMAYLNSSLAATLLEALVAFGSDGAGGAPSASPFMPLGSEANRSAQLTELRQRRAERDELDHLFVSPWVSQSDIGDAVGISRAIDSAAADSVGTEEVLPLAAMYPTAWFGLALSR